MIPGGPTQPPSPVPTANVVGASGLTIGLCDGPGFECFYELDYRNDGAGCGNNLRGRVRLYRDDTLLDSDDWFLDPTMVLRPGELVRVDDCCFERDSVTERTRFTSETFWNNVFCG